MCVALAALDAVVHLRSADGERTLPLTDLHRLPGDHPEIETVLEPGELITAVELPALPFAAHSTYRKVRDRASYAFALVSVAAALEVEDGTVRDVRLALGGVATKPWRAWKAEEALRGRPATAESFRAAAEAELAAAAPLRDNAFKIELARRTIAAVLDELTGLDGMSIVGDAVQVDDEDRGSARAGELGAGRRARSADPARARADRRAGVAPRRPAQGDGRRALRGRVHHGRHGLRRARLQHDREGPHRDARHERGRGSARRRARDDAPERAADEADAALHDARERRPAATTCRSCRTTGSTGTASRSRSCSPRRRSRPTTPGR